MLMPLIVVFLVLMWGGLPCFSGCVQLGLICPIWLKGLYYLNGASFLQMGASEEWLPAVRLSLFRVNCFASFEHLSTFLVLIYFNWFTCLGPWE